jgi:hypothetical protein
MNTTTAINGLISIEKSQISGIISPEGEMPNLGTCFFIIFAGVLLFASIRKVIAEFKWRNMLLREHLKCEVERCREVYQTAIECCKTRFGGMKYISIEYENPPGYEEEKMLCRPPICLHHSVIIVTDTRYEKPYPKMEFRIHWTHPEFRVEVATHSPRTPQNTFVWSIEKFQSAVGNHPFDTPAPFYVERHEEKILA